MSDTTTAEILRLNQRLLESIAQTDWAAYADLCDPSLTAIEPESQGQLVEGLEFHRFYFNLGGGSQPRHTTMCPPVVKRLGDVAVITYVRLNQSVDATGIPITRVAAETRVWQLQDGRWKQVHFHRSPIA